MTDELDIATVLDHYGIAYRGDRASEQMICCPVHEDRKPSASLNLGKGLFNCHACGQNGDALTIIMYREELRYAPALQKYEEITGDSNSSVRRKSFDGASSKPIPVGSGYKPRINRKIPTGVRRRTDFGA